MTRLATAFKKLIRKLQPVDYFAAYQCKVVGQNADGTLELEPFDERLNPGPTHVEIDVPPGVDKVTVQNGALCMVSFRNGKPDAPYVNSWSIESRFSELSIRASTLTLNGGTQPVARKGDQIGTLTGSTMPGGGAVTFVYTAPDGKVITSPTIVLTIGQGNTSIKA